MADNTYILELEQRFSGPSIATELDRLDAAFGAARKRYDEFESASIAAAKGLDKVSSQLETVRAKMASAMAAGDEKAFWRAAAATAELEKRQAALKTTAAAAAKGMADESAVLTNLANQAQTASKATGSVEDAAKGFKKLGGPLGKAGNAVEDLSEGWAMLEESMGTAGAALAAGAALVAVAVVAVVALGAALLAGAAAAYKWAISLADVNRTQGLLAAGIEGTVAGGELLDAKLSDLTKRMPLTRDELSGMAVDLRKAGYQGQALADKLEETATTAAKAKFGPEWSKQMNSLDQLSKRFSQNLSETFGGLNIEGLLAGLSKLVDLFDANTESGKALKVLFESIFQPLLDQGDVFTLLERGILMLEIAVLQLGIAFKDMTKDTDFGPLWDLLSIVGDVAWGIFVGFLTEIGTTFMWIVGIVTNVVDAFNWLVDQANEIGPSIIDGLISALTGGQSEVIKAVTDLAGGAIDAAKGVLGIHSPSKVFDEIGGQVGEGFVGGVDDSAPMAASALESMAAPPDVKGGKTAGAGATVNIENVNVSGVEKAEDVPAALRDELADLLEGVWFQGAPA